MMKPASLLQLALCVLLSLSIMSCSSSRQNTPSSTFNDFKSWVSNTASSAADKSEEEWKNLKGEYKQFTNTLDREEDKWSAKAKAEYKELKQDYKQLEANAEQRFRESGNDPNSKTPSLVTPQTLLGKYSRTDQLTEAELPDAYQEFIRNVRDNMNNWTTQQWDEVDQVYQQLEQQRSKVNISTADAARIRVWQGEYHSLKATHKKL